MGVLIKKVGFVFSIIISLHSVSGIFFFRPFGLPSFPFNLFRPPAIPPTSITPTAPLVTTTEAEEEEDTATTIATTTKLPIQISAGFTTQQIFNQTGGYPIFGPPIFGQGQGQIFGPGGIFGPGVYPPLPPVGGVAKPVGKPPSHLLGPNPYPVGGTNFPVGGPNQFPVGGPIQNPVIGGPARPQGSLLSLLFRPGGGGLLGGFSRPSGGFPGLGGIATPNGKK